MKPLIGRPMSMLVISAIVGGTQACALSSDSPGEAAAAQGTVGQELTGGKLINNGDDEVAARFPLSTVTIRCLQPGGVGVQCTGETLSSIQILTAAHCCPPGSTLTNVYQYSSFPGFPANAADAVTRASPTSTSVYSAAPFPTLDTPGGVTGVNLPTGGYDASGNYADLAILTLPSPLPGPVTPTLPGLPGSYSGLGGDQQSLWEVGTGNMNNQANPQKLMDWIPISLASTNDNGGRFSARGTEKGQAVNEGDSGGPVYQKFGSALLVVGTASYYYPTLDTNTAYYTSVLSPTNRTWIMNHYVAPPAPQDVQRGLELLDPGGHPRSLVADGTLGGEGAWLAGLRPD